MDPAERLADPLVRMEVARRVAVERMRRANALVHAIDRLKLRARREVERAKEMLQIAEDAAIEHAIKSAEERAIAEEW